MKTAFQVTRMLLCLAPLFGHGQAFSWVRDSNGILLREGQENILYYQQRTKALHGDSPRAHYIHPLYAPGGSVITEDFPEDHLHHRGVFWAWHQVWLGEKKMGDAWECRDFIWDVLEATPMQSEGVLELHTRIHWKSPDHADSSGHLIPLVEEQSKITVQPLQDPVRILDFEISLTALVPGLRIGGSEDSKGYGGFSLRVKLPDDLRFHSASGEIAPEENAVTAANWIDISGSLATPGKQMGLVLISKNDFDTGGTPWILRRKASMQNAVFPGRNPIELPVDRPLKLQYRMIIYQGTMDRESLNTWIAE